MAQNITLLGASYSDVPAVNLPKTGGGTATFTDTTPTTAAAADVASGKYFFTAAGAKTLGTATIGGVTVTTTTDPVAGGDIVTITATQNVSLLKMGVVRPDAELVKTYTYDKKMVADEQKTLPAYNTSAQTIMASASLSPTVSMDNTNYDYYVLVRGLIIPIYNTTTKAKGRPDYGVTSAVFEIAQTPASSFTTIDGTKTYTSQYITVTTAGILYRMPYWTSGSAIAVYNGTYGTYIVPAAPTVSGSTLTLKSPAPTMRGSTTYFTSGRWAEVTDLRMQYRIEVYRAPKGNYGLDGWGCNTQMAHIINDLHNNNFVLT